MGNPLLSPLPHLPPLLVSFPLVGSTVEVTTYSKADCTGTSQTSPILNCAPESSSYYYTPVAFAVYQSAQCSSTAAPSALPTHAPSFRPTTSPTPQPSVAPTRWNTSLASGSVAAAVVLTICGFSVILFVIGESASYNDTTLFSLLLCDMIRSCGVLILFFPCSTFSGLLHLLQ